MNSEVTMQNILIEENGIYGIDCTRAVWFTDRIHEDYHRAGIHINDADFIIENEDKLLMVEYKNANIPGAASPGSFKPEQDKKLSTTARKFYDSLHYLKLMEKTKPVQYIYVLEYPDGDAVTRRRLRNKLKAELPFALQENIGNGIKLIDKVDVVSIDEWNQDQDYGRHPISPIVPVGS